MSAATATGRTTVRELFATDLLSGLSQTLALLSRPGDRPALALTRFRAGRVETRVLFHVTDLEPIDRALALVAEPAFVGVQSAGRLPTGEIFVEVFAMSDSVHGPTVAIGRVKRDGTPLGDKTYLNRHRLEALRVGVAELKRLTGGVAA